MTDKNTHWRVHVRVVDKLKPGTSSNLGSRVGGEIRKLKVAKAKADTEDAAKEHARKYYVKRQYKNVEPFQVDKLTESKIPMLRSFRKFITEAKSPGALGVDSARDDDRERDKHRRALKLARDKKERDRHKDALEKYEGGRFHGEEKVEEGVTARRMVKRLFTYHELKKRNKEAAAAKKEPPKKDIKESDEHEARKDHTKNVFHKVLAKHGWHHVSTTHEKNHLAKDNPKFDSTVHRYEHKDHGKSHIVVTQHHHVTGPYKVPKHNSDWLWRHHQKSNDIVAPYGKGESKTSLDRSLHQQYGTGGDTVKETALQPWKSFREFVTEGPDLVALAKSGKTRVLEPEKKPEPNKPKKEPKPFDIGRELRNPRNREFAKALRDKGSEGPRMR